MNRIKSNVSQIEIYFDTLDSFLEKRMFPSEKRALEILKSLSRAGNFTHKFCDESFAFNTRNRNWLVSYINTKYNDRSDRDKVLDKIKYIPVDYIKYYVDKSPSFEQRRTAYEEILVKGYIQLAQDTEVDDFYAGKTIKKVEQTSNDYDILFRKRVVGAMKFLGVDAVVTEKVLEENANLWRNQTRKQAFLNTYTGDNPFLSCEDRQYLAKNEPELLNELKTSENTLFQNWDALRDAKYYKEHHKIIDKFNLATPQMKMSPEGQYDLAANMQKLGINYKKNMVRCTTKIYDRLREAAQVDKEVG